MTCVGINRACEKFILAESHEIISLPPFTSHVWRLLLINEYTTLLFEAIIISFRTSSEAAEMSCCPVEILNRFQNSRQLDGGEKCVQTQTKLANLILCVCMSLYVYALSVPACCCVYLPVSQRVLVPRCAPVPALCVW